FLDDPFPANLPVVPSCRECNSSFSLDEEYCAALIDSVVIGTAEPTDRHRPKVRRILERRPALSKALQSIRTADAESGETAFAPDPQRIENVCLKLARGHAAFELHTVEDDGPSCLSICPLPVMDTAMRAAFESPPEVDMLP